MLESRSQNPEDGNRPAIPPWRRGVGGLIPFPTPISLGIRMSFGLLYTKSR